MKKALLTLAALAITFQTSYAAIGFVDYNAIVQNYGPAKRAIAELDKKEMDMKQFIMQKEIEIMKTADTNKKTVQKQAVDNLKAKQTEYAKLKQTKEAELTKSIIGAVNSVRAEKKLEIIISSQGVLSGGVDCTQAVMKKLNGK